MNERPAPPSASQSAPLAPTPPVAARPGGLTGHEIRNFCLAGIALAAAAFIPIVSNGYVLSLANSIAVYTALATSWTLFSGPTN